MEQEIIILQKQIKNLHPNNATRVYLQKRLDSFLIKNNNTQIRYYNQRYGCVGKITLHNDNNHVCHFCNIKGPVLLMYVPEEHGINICRNCHNNDFLMNKYRINMNQRSKL